MGALTVWILVIITVVITILVILYFRWKHSKSELNYTKWMNDRVSDRNCFLSVATATVHSNDCSTDQSVF